MNLRYTYTKKRLQFGRQCSFSDYQKVEVDIKPHTGYANNYITVDPATHGTQCGKTYSMHKVQIHAGILSRYIKYVISDINGFRY